ncbi:N-acetyltransferase [Deinococcus psychrotolerans]|uniref:N-acetyltransferase n=1 Tax=Deinococcus psychrotolerans TaxID=2489213 RepID=A0A3G8YI91_9DEIO|nr:GNAT family N-acetyltransferase [Deinococcus psychrotolerans]AZI43947.1 N-acetyltransferase [Deinococcus psychrotolerans]
MSGQQRAELNWGRVRLKPLLEMNNAEWRTLYSYFRDRELADWNGAQPIRLPEWLFRKVMQDEERSGERHGFGIMNEDQRLIGSIELYDLRPSPPSRPTTATLGVMIGERTLWGGGYGREAVQATLDWAFGTRQPTLRRIRLTTFLHNRRAQRAFAASGFREMGRTEHAKRTDVHMEITLEEWNDAQAAHNDAHPRPDA